MLPKVLMLKFVPVPLENLLSPASLTLITLFSIPLSTQLRNGPFIVKWVRESCMLSKCYKRVDLMTRLE